MRMPAWAIVDDDASLEQFGITFLRDLWSLCLVVIGAGRVI
jgi:hypothetical protein